MLASQSRAGVFVRLFSSILHQRRKHLREKRSVKTLYSRFREEGEGGEKRGRGGGGERRRRHTLHLYNQVHSLQFGLKMASIWSVTLT